MKQGRDKSIDLQAELAALRKRVAELESHEAELSWAHETLLGQISREHKQTETALRLSEQKLSRIFAASPDAIAISSLASGKYIDANPAFERVFGYAPQEAIGRTAVEMEIWPDLAQREKFIASLQSRADSSTTKRNFGTSPAKSSMHRFPPARSSLAASLAC